MVIYYFLLIKINIMGKGDKRSKRGKIWRGSYGKARPKQKNIEKDENNEAEVKKTEE